MLTEDDVSRLLADTSGTARAETAAKLASDFTKDDLTEKERILAEEIFRIMVKDAEVRVREALALNLKENPSVPHDVAVNLARDVDSVALPMLKFSEVLTDDDLVEIVRSQGATRQIAVAERDTVSAVVSDALVESGNEEVVTSLVSNRGADISEKSLSTVVDKFSSSEKVQGAMVHRPKLPVTIAERLVTLVSEKLRDELTQRHELSPTVTTDLILQARERATISLSSMGDETDLWKLISQLRKNGRLTPSLVLRALCMGDLSFYEFSVAELAGVSVENVRKLIHDSGELGLKGLYDKTGLPSAHYPAARAAIDVARETEYDGGELDRERYSRRMLERVLTQYGDLGVEFDSDDLEYLLTKMNELPSDVVDAA
jgi:uncharacterized protein (DUF2336 family)